MTMQRCCFCGSLGATDEHLSVCRAASRNHFAAAALQAFLSPNSDQTVPQPRVAAQNALMYADALVKAIEDE